ncbi:transcription initiation factor IIE, beta subunit [Rhizopogon salebrosus TDB-379]|nr:transcription initiation factor IIE, beta subunit [Rhizopogon salebrosus TDB-379]
MASLNKDADAFKRVLHRQDYTSWHSQPVPLNSSPASTSASTPAPDLPATKKKRPKTNIVYSQPADTGTGTNVNTQLVYAIDHLKSTHNPMRLQDIAIVTNTPLDTDSVLLEKFKAHDRIQWDPKTDLYSYRHEFSFRNKAALLTEIQRQTRKGGGIPVRALKESWKDAPSAIEELEKEGEVLVTRTVKDGQLRMVFWNEIKPDDENGGKQVEKEFFDLWHSLKVPNDVDLLKALHAEGLQATAEETPIPKAPSNVKKKGKRSAPRQRQAKITNTHLKGEIDLSRDYDAHRK